MKQTPLRMSSEQGRKDRLLLKSENTYIDLKKQRWRVTDC